MSAISRVCRVCIVGGGPAGFYAAQKVIKLLPEATVDILEKLPVPFGLVRFGVAPDHPEVKNVITTFTKTAQNKNVNFYGNICLGKDISLSQLRKNYHAVLLSYGADQDRLLEIPNENIANVLSARRFVGWYNGSPFDRDLKVDLSGPSVGILGQGNVAVDAARILLTPVDALRKTDIAENALAALAHSKIKSVHLIGRRGPLQAAFTIKELRELLKLENCRTIWRDKDFEGIEKIVETLPRHRKRITELMLKNLSDSSNRSTGTRNFLPIFFRSPLKFLLSDSGKLKGVHLAVNRLTGDDLLTQTCEETEQREILNCDLVLRSIGYKSRPADADINFNHRKGLVENLNGRVLLKNGDSKFMLDGKPVDVGLYVSGWLKTGPTGVILDTMANSFDVASTLCSDLTEKKDLLDCSKSKAGFEGIRTILEQSNVQIVTWTDWEKIDKHEQENGNKKGKVREKICDINQMLNICK